MYAFQMIMSVGVSVEWLVLRYEYGLVGGEYGFLACFGVLYGLAEGGLVDFGVLDGLGEGGLVETPVGVGVGTAGGVGVVVVGGVVGVGARWRCGGDSG